MNRESVSTEHLWDALNAKQKSFLLQRVSDQQVAEDLLQETFLRIHNKLDQIDDEQRITTWVFQIARNLVIGHYRSKSRIATALAEDLEISPERGKSERSSQKLVTHNDRSAPGFLSGGG